MFIDELYINVLLGFLTALLLFGAFFWWFYQNVSQESRVLKEKIILKNEENQKLHIELSKYKERIGQRDLMRQEFEQLAQGILTHNSEMLSQHNSKNLQHIITPFKENIKSFHDRLENYYDAESKERYSLTKEIHKLQMLNVQISEDAHNLTNALKGDNKLQGDWGEMILERVLENSGLKKGREYSIQKSLQNEHGERLRPDVIINLPEDKQIVVDSKVSLKSYENYYHDSENKQKHLQAFITSLKSHIKLLSEKSYQKLEGINSLDFVLLFIPIEGAFMLAGEEESTLLPKRTKIISFWYHLQHS